MFQFLAATSGLHIALSGCQNKSAFIPWSSGWPGMFLPAGWYLDTSVKEQPWPLGWRTLFFGAAPATWLAEEFLQSVHGHLVG